MDFNWINFKTLMQRSHSKSYIFKQCLISKGLSSIEIKKLEPYFHSRTYLEGEMIFSRNDPAKALYIICDGEVSIISSGEHGAQHETLEGLDFFGEAGAILPHHMREVSAKCTKQASILTLTQSGLRELSTRHPRVGLKIYSNLATICFHKLQVANSRIKKIHSLIQNLKGGTQT